MYNMPQQYFGANLTPCVFGYFFQTHFSKFSDVFRDWLIQKQVWHGRSIGAQNGGGDSWKWSVDLFWQKRPMGEGAEWRLAYSCS